MAFWRRIKHSQMRILSDKFHSSYFQVHGPYSTNQNASRTNFLLLNHQYLPIQKNQFEFSKNVRFFAAPVQFTQKKEEKDADGPRLNERITAEVIRLVTDEGHFVLPKLEALRRARNLKLDLVEVQRNAKPPVCKIMDYHREKYVQELKEKDRAKSKPEVSLRKGSCKEIRFTGKITQKDLQIKADTVKRLMERGYRVKCVASGNQTGGENSAAVLSRFFALIEDVSVVESDTRVEEKDQAHVIVRHVKYGQLKKGSGKKGSKDNKSAGASAQEVESDDDALSEDMPADSVEEKDKSSWRVSDANDDFENLFDLKNNLDDALDDAPDNLSNDKSSSVPGASGSSRGVSSQYARPMSVPDSAGTNTALTNSSEASQNRYMKEPRNRSQPPNPMDVRRSDMRRTPSYGVFNAQQVENAHGEQRLPAEVNRYQQKNPSDSRSSGLAGFRGHANSPLQNSKVGREQTVDEDGKGRWGIFSGERSSMAPNRKFQGHAKVQR